MQVTAYGCDTNSTAQNSSDNLPLILCLELGYTATVFLKTAQACI